MKRAFERAALARRLRRQTVAPQIAVPLSKLRLAEMLAAVICRFAEPVPVFLLPGFLINHQRSNENLIMRPPQLHVVLICLRRAAKTIDKIEQSAVFLIPTGMDRVIKNLNGLRKQCTLTRAMLVTILYRIEGEPSVSYSGKFSDVPSGRWYSKAVEWAAAQGIVGGYSNGKFGPEDSVTREQLAAILYRYAGKTKGFDVSASASLSGYTDSAKVSAYAQSAVKWAIATNLLLPTSGKLNAGADATRAEVAVAVARFHQQLVK